MWRSDCWPDGICHGLFGGGRFVIREHRATAAPHRQKHLADARSLIAFTTGAIAKVPKPRPASASIISEPRLKRERVQIGEHVVRQIHKRARAVEHDIAVGDHCATRQHTIRTAFGIVSVRRKTVAMGERLRRCGNVNGLRAAHACVARRDRRHARTHRSDAPSSIDCQSVCVAGCVNHARHEQQIDVGDVGKIANDHRGLRCAQRHGCRRLKIDGLQHARIGDELSRPRRQIHDHLQRTQRAVVDSEIADAAFEQRIVKLRASDPIVDRVAECRWRQGHTRIAAHQNSVHVQPPHLRVSVRSPNDVLPHVRGQRRAQPLNTLCGGRIIVVAEQSIPAATWRKKQVLAAAGAGADWKILTTITVTKIENTRPIPAASIRDPRLDSEGRVTSDDVVRQIHVAADTIKNDRATTDGSSVHELPVGRADRIVGIGTEWVTMRQSRGRTVKKGNAEQSPSGYDFKFHLLHFSSLETYEGNSSLQ